MVVYSNPSKSGGLASRNEIGGLLAPAARLAPVISTFIERTCYSVQRSANRLATTCSYPTSPDNRAVIPAELVEAGHGVRGNSGGVVRSIPPYQVLDQCRLIRRGNSRWPTSTARDGSARSVRCASTTARTAPSAVVRRVSSISLSVATKRRKGVVPAPPEERGPRRGSSTTLPIPLRTATSAPIALAQNPSINSLLQGLGGMDAEGHARLAAAGHR